MPHQTPAGYAASNTVEPPVHQHSEAWAPTASGVQPAQQPQHRALPQPQYQAPHHLPYHPPVQQVVVQRAAKEVGLAYIWLIFFGNLGIHQFYLGKTGRGLAYLFTLGFLGVGSFIDLFTLPRQVRAANAEIAAGRR